MIICDIDVTTKEGLEEFNKKYEGEFKVYHTEDGGIALEGVSKEQRPIFHNVEKNKSENN